MTVEEDKTKSVTISGHTWTVIDSYEDGQLKYSYLQRPDGKIFRSIAYDEKGDPRTVLLYSKEGDKPIVQCVIKDGKLDNFVIDESDKKHFVNDSDNNRLQQVLDTNPIKSIDLRNQNAAIISNGILTARLARALMPMPGQKLDIKNPFNYAITKIGPDGAIQSGRYPSPEGNSQEVAYFPNGAVKGKREIMQNGTNLHAFPHPNERGERAGQRPETYAHTAMNIDDAGKLNSFTLFHPVGEQHHYVAAVQKDGSVAELLQDEKGKKLWQRHISIADYASGNDLKTLVRQLHGNKQKKDELAAVEQLRKLRPKAIERAKELLALYDMDVDFEKDPGTIITKPFTQVLVVPGPPILPSEPVKLAEAAAQAVSLSNMKESDIFISGHTWKLQEYFDESGARTKVLQLKPNGKPYRELEYKEEKLAFVHLFMDDGPYPVISYSFREDVKRPYLVYRNNQNGKVKNALHLLSDVKANVVDYDMEQGQIGAPKDTISASGINPLSHVVYYFNEKSLTVAKAIQPIEGFDLGLPDINLSQWRVVGQHPDGNYHELRRLMSDGSYERNFYGAGGNFHAMHTVTEESSVIESKDGNDATKARLVTNADGTPRKFLIFYPRKNPKDLNEVQQASVEVTFYEHEGKKLFDVTRRSRKGEIVPYKSQNEVFKYLNGVSASKWGQKVAICDLTYAEKYEGQMNRVVTSATLENTEQFAQLMEHIQSIPAVVLPPAAPQPEPVVKESGVEIAETSPSRGDDTIRKVVTEVAATKTAPAYKVVEYYNKEDPAQPVDPEVNPFNPLKQHTKKKPNSLPFKIETLREDGTLQIRDEKAADGGGTITYFWKDVQDRAGKPVPRSVIKYNATPHEKWNSHIQLVGLNADPIRNSDRHFVVEQAKDDLKAMFAHHGQDIIVDLSHVHRLDEAHINAIKALQEMLADPWARAVTKVSTITGDDLFREIAGEPDRPATRAQREQLLEALQSKIKAISEQGALYPERDTPTVGGAHRELVRMLTSLSGKAGNTSALRKTIDEIRQHARDTGVDISPLNLDALTEEVNVPWQDREKFLAQLRRGHHQDLADQLEAEYKTASALKSQIHISGIEGLDVLPRFREATLRNLKPKMDALEAGGAAPEVIASLRGLADSADDTEDFKKALRETWTLAEEKNVDIKALGLGALTSDTLPPGWKETAIAQMKRELQDKAKIESEQFLPAHMNARDPDSKHYDLCITRREDYNKDGKKIYSEDYENGKIKLEKGKYKFREHDPKSGNPKQDPKALARPLLFDDISARETAKAKG